MNDTLAIVLSQYKLVFAAAATLIVMRLAFHKENTDKETNAQSIDSNNRVLMLLTRISSASIVFTSVFYICEYRDRSQDKIFKAWQVANSAQVGPIPDRAQELQDGTTDSAFTEPRRPLPDGGRSAALAELSDSNEVLRGLQLSRVNMNKLKLKPDADMSGSNMDRASLADAILKGALLTNGSFRLTEFSFSHLEEADFSDSLLSGAIFHRTYIDQAKFKNIADMKNVDFRGASGDNAVFINSIIVGASFHAGQMPGTDFRGATIGNGTSFFSANLRGAKLQGTTLTSLDLTRSDLRSADFSGATFENVDLRYANLIGSNITDKQIERGKAKLCGTKLPQSLEIYGDRDCDVSPALRDPIKIDGDRSDTNVVMGCEIREKDGEQCAVRFYDNAQRKHAVSVSNNMHFINRREYVQIQYRWRDSVSYCVCFGRGIERVPDTSTGCQQRQLDDGACLLKRISSDRPYHY